MEGNITRGIATGVVTSTGNALGEIATAIFWGSFNPKYNKEDRKRMRYIQNKYCQAYGNGEGQDLNAIIAGIDPTSKLKMNDEGTKPSNPFSSEKDFEDTLEINYYPTSGHQGRFSASHAMQCEAKIIEYQNRRRKRPWIPKLSNPGKPNDYINMFLHEMKTWLKSQLTLDTVHADELRKRADYISKLKHDNFYWCFPMEREESGSSPGPKSSSLSGGSSNGSGMGSTIHSVIDFVHNRVQDALDVVVREEKNKSMQSLFKELNDHTTNAFEYGKSFLSFILAASNKAGADLLSSAAYDGSTFEKGKLHHLLLAVTVPVMQSYVTDMIETDKRIESGNVGYPYGNALGIGLQSVENGSSADRQAICNGPDSSSDSKSMLMTIGYDIDVPFYADGVSITIYSILIKDPDGNKWLVKKSYADFKSLHQAIGPYYERVNSPLDLPANVSMFAPTTDQYVMKCAELRTYLIQAVTPLRQIPVEIRRILAQFLETKEIALPKAKLVMAEKIPNVFVDMKSRFREHLVQGHGYEESVPDSSAVIVNGGGPQRISGRGWSMGFSLLGNNSESTPGASATSRRDASPGSKDTDNSTVDSVGLHEKSAGTAKQFDALRTTWGIDWVFRIFEAYALLQRMATVLSWTLEINHFFVSMFGNTLTFSKLPLRDILATQKEILSSFLMICKDLFTYSCQLNSEQMYKWHKNLQLSESQLKMLKFHTDVAVSAISCIETEHLDYSVQLKRLQDVASRFQPFMSRVDGSLRQIQQELGLTVAPSIDYTAGANGYQVLEADSSDADSEIKPHAAGSKAIEYMPNSSPVVLLAESKLGPGPGVAQNKLTKSIPVPMHLTPNPTGAGIMAEPKPLNYRVEEPSSMKLAPTDSAAGAAGTSRDSGAKAGPSIVEVNDEPARRGVQDGLSSSLDDAKVSGHENSAVCAIS